MPEPAASQLLPAPAVGRTFTAERLVRFGDLSRGGRLRFDALARYLQDVSGDDTADAGLVDDIAWVVRRTLVEVTQSPRFRERVAMTTFCSGTGRSWAERRVSLVGEQGGGVEAVSLWVHLDAESGRPLALPEGFHDHYGEAAGGRRVSARLALPAEVPADAVRTPWPLRATDLDPLGHVNNAATWAVVEEVLAAHRGVRPPLRAEIEYRLPIDGDDHVEVATVARDDSSVAIWLVEPGPAGASRAFAAARLTPIEASGSR